MATMEKNNVLNGSDGRLYMDNEKMANIKSFELKESANFESFYINGNYVEQHRRMGSSLSGTMVFHGIDSRILKKYMDTTKSGFQEGLTLVGSQCNPGTSQTQRVKVTDVQFTEVTLLKFENNTMLEEEVPFNAGGV